MHANRRRLRKVIRPQVHDNYRVILKREGDEVEIGPIGIQHGAAWRWGIDTVIPMRVLETQGKGKDRRDCMRQFRAAWDRFAAGYPQRCSVPWATRCWMVSATTD